MKKVGIIYIIFIIISTANLSAQTLTATFNGVEGSPMHNLISLYMSELGDKIGYTIDVKLAPLERAEINLKSGNVDIDIGRTEFVYDESDPVSYTTYPVLVTQYFFVSKKDIDPNDSSTWKGLKLVTTRGNKIIENWIEENNFSSSNVSWVKDDGATIKSLMSGRADFAITIGITYNSWMKDPVVANSGVNLIQPAAFPSPAFLVISNKHKSLVPEISQAVKELAESGRTAEIFAPPK